MSLAQVKAAAEADDVQGFVDALVAVAGLEGYWGNKFAELRNTVKLSRLAIRIPAAVELWARIPSIKGDNTFLEYALDALLTEDSSHSSLADAQVVLKIAAGAWEFHSHCQLEVLAKKVLEAGGTLDDDMVAVMRRTAATDRILREFISGIKHPPLNPGEPWADRALADLSTLDSPWPDLVIHAWSSSDPTPEWQSQGRVFLTAVGPDEYRRVITTWLALINQPRTRPVSPRCHGFDLEYATDLHNNRALRGLLWLLGLVPPDAALARLLADLVEANLRKVPGLGPRNPKVAAGALHALTHLDHDEADAQLARLTKTAPNKRARESLRAALETRAATHRPIPAA